MDVSICWDWAGCKLMLANDVESNPGPRTNSRKDKKAKSFFKGRANTSSNISPSTSSNSKSSLPDSTKLGSPYTSSIASSSAATPSQNAPSSPVADTFETSSNSNTRGENTE